MTFMRGGGGRFGMGAQDAPPIPKERRGRTVRRIVAFFRPYRLPVVIVLVAILATSLIGLVNPYLLKLLIDDVIVGHHFELLNLYVGLMIVLPIVSGLIGVGQLRRAVSTETQKSLADITAATEETLSVSGMLLMKTFGQQASQLDRFRRLNRILAALQIRQAMVGRWFFMIIGTIFSITPAFVYWLAGTLAASGDPSAPTAGVIVAFTTLQSRLFFPLGQLLNVQVEIQGSLALFDRIFEYLEMDPEIVDAPDAVSLDARTVRGRVRFHHVAFRYPLAAVPSARALASAHGHRHEVAVALSAASATTPEVAEVLTEDADGSAAIAPPPILPFALEDIDFEV